MKKGLCRASLFLLTHSTYSLRPPLKWYSVSSTLLPESEVALKPMVALLLRKASSRRRPLIISGSNEILHEEPILITSSSGKELHWHSICVSLDIGQRMREEDCETSRLPV